MTGIYNGYDRCCHRFDHWSLQTSPHLNKLLNVYRYCESYVTTTDLFFGALTLQTVSPKEPVEDSVKQFSFWMAIRSECT